MADKEEAPLLANAETKESGDIVVGGSEEKPEEKPEQKPVEKPEEKPEETKNPLPKRPGFSSQGTVLDLGSNTKHTPRRPAKLEKVDSKFFASHSARDFAKEAGSLICGAQDEWSDPSKGSEQERRRGFLKALQDLHMTSFTRSKYLAICDECKEKGEDPCYEILKLARAIQVHVLPRRANEIFSEELEVSVFLRHQIRDKEVVRTLVERNDSVTVGRFGSSTILIPADRHAISRLQVVVLYVQTKLGGLAMIIDPGSVGGTALTKKENVVSGAVETFAPAATAESSSQSEEGVAIAAGEGGIIFVGEEEIATCSLGKKHKNTWVDMTVKTVPVEAKKKQEEEESKEELKEEQEEEEVKEEKVEEKVEEPKAEEERKVEVPQQNDGGLSTGTLVVIAAVIVGAAIFASRWSK